MESRPIGEGAGFIAHRALRRASLVSQPSKNDPNHDQRGNGSGHEPHDLWHMAREVKIWTFRERLPQRRPSITFNFQCGSHVYTATISYFPGTNRLTEIFLGNGRAGSDVDAAAKDSAVVASIALQHGVPVDVIRRALLRDPRGIASSPLGVALDILASGWGEP
jgi:hypothetical protein